MIKIGRVSAEEIDSILAESQDFADGKVCRVDGDVFAANLFFENSTRTRISFEVAEKRLGLHVVNFDADRSSINKGETLLDTIKTIEAIGIDLAVIRHSQDRYYDQLISSKIALVNGGDGQGSHPTQAFLDALTIKQEFGEFAGLNVGIVGDVKHSRVAKSTSLILRRLGAKVFFSGPEFWFDEGMLVNGTYHPLDSLIREVDVLIMLRIQNERHINKVQISQEDYLRKYGLTKEREKEMKKHAIIMHPAPINRGVEIDGDLVECERSRIFKQMQNGVFARMAILKQTLRKKGYNFNG